MWDNRVEPSDDSDQQSEPPSSARSNLQDDQSHDGQAAIELTNINNHNNTGTSVGHFDDPERLKSAKTERSTPTGGNNEGETSKKGEEEEGKEEKKEEETKTVGVIEFFRFGKCVDILLTIVAIICACGVGTALPALMIIFGDMTDAFIDSALYDEYVDLVKVDCRVSTLTLGYTVEEALEDDNKIPDMIDRCNFTLEEGNKDPVEVLQGDHKLLPQMRTFAIYYVIIACGVIVCAIGQVTFILLASYRQTQRIRLRLFRTIMRQEIGWFDCHETGELNTRLSDDVNKIQEGLGDKITNFFQWFATFVAGVVIAFVFSWKLTLVILATGPLLVISGLLMSKLSTSATTNELAAYAKAGAVAEEVFGAIRTVVAFGGQQKELERYKVHLGDAQKFGVRKGMAAGGSMGVVYFIFFAVYALAFWYGGKLVRENEITVGDMIIAMFSVLFGCFALGNTGPNLSSFGQGRGAAYTIFGIIDRESEIDSFMTEGEQPAEVNGTVGLENVSFYYPSRPEVQILNGLNLEVKIGQTAALVGSSGCGKSTVIQLLQRFYDPLEGSVKLDGRDVKDLNVGWLRRHIGVVSQEPVLFATTIRENIRFGRDGVTNQEIEEACKQANAYDFITKLPDQFDTLVGERGSQLSGGQKQRIAIARAIVRNPRVLLLDEATSALDNESEAIVQNALDKASAGRTTLVIAHRLSTIKNADIIFGLKEGQVHESGTHSQLMGKGEKGIYSQLVNNQQTLGDDGLELQHEEEQYQKQHGAAEKAKLHHQDSHAPSTHHDLAHSKSTTEAKPEDKKEEEEVELSTSAVLRLMRLNSPECCYIILGCVGALVNGAVQPGFAVLFAGILGVFDETDLEKQKDEIRLYSLLVLAIGIAAGIGMLLQAAMFALSGEKLTTRIRELMFATYTRQDISYFDDPDNSTGAICTRLATDASAIQGATGARLGTIFNALSSLGAGIIIGFIYSWQLTLLIIGFTPFLIIGGLLEMRLLGGTAGEGREALESAGKVAVEGIENIRTVACLTKEEWFCQEYEKHTTKPYKANIRKAGLVGFAYAFSQGIIYFLYAAVFYLGGYLIDDDKLNFEDMFRVFGAIAFAAMSVGNASHFAPDYTKAKSAAAKMFETLDREPEIDSYSDEGDKPASVQGNLVFEDVHFQYPTRPDVKVLQGLNIQVSQGQTIALVGSSGCGKSTSVALLERFYNPAQGRILLDGKEVMSLNIQWLRHQMGIVQQEPILFGTSIKENIAYGDNEREVSMDEIIQAARDANIHSFIETLPEGYETNVGDKGAQLSGGQKQRVAIARALVRNPKILLLDEATSALDTESEKVVQEALDKAQKGRTSLVIAHRLSTVQNANKIVVIHHGKVSEAGTHSELLGKKGIYYKLHLAQQKKKDKN